MKYKTPQQIKIECILAWIKEELARIEKRIYFLENGI